MALPLPSSLSPSKVTAFRDCALAFRLANIDRLPEPPSPYATKGTLVHRALQLLFWEEPPGKRSQETALHKLDRAAEELFGSDPEFIGLGLDSEAKADFVADAATLVGNYYQLEDPDAVRVIGTELRMSAQIGDLRISGIIDRLELGPDGQLVVTDYKTGRAPSVNYEQPKLIGVHFYALLCEEVLGRRPTEIRLLHLREPLVISAVPTEQSLRGTRLQTSAVWQAVERSCQTEDFRPKPSWLCASCAYHAYCPAKGGDLSLLPAPADASTTPRLRSPSTIQETAA